MSNGPSCKIKTSLIIGQLAVKAPDLEQCRRRWQNHSREQQETHLRIIGLHSKSPRAKFVQLLASKQEVTAGSRSNASTRPSSQKQPKWPPYGHLPNRTMDAVDSRSVAWMMRALPGKVPLHVPP